VFSRAVTILRLPLAEQSTESSSSQHLGADGLEQLSAQRFGQNVCYVLARVNTSQSHASSGDIMSQEVMLNSNMPSIIAGSLISAKQMAAPASMKTYPVGERLEPR
jgi:hypothetical protein